MLTICSTPILHKADTALTYLYHKSNPSSVLEHFCKRAVTGPSSARDSWTCPSRRAALVQNDLAPTIELEPKRQRAEMLSWRRQAVTVTCSTLGTSEPLAHTWVYVIRAFLSMARPPSGTTWYPGSDAPIQDEKNYIYIYIDIYMD